MGHPGQEGESKQRIYKKLRNKYRLVVMNVDTFQERFSFVLSPLNVFTVSTLLALLVFAITSMLFVFTPLKELIPGYIDLNTRKNAAYAVIKADSLNDMYRLNQQYIENLSAIWNGEEPKGKYPSSPQPANPVDLNYKGSVQDSLLREKVEQEEKYNLLQPSEDQDQANIGLYHFFSPLKGPITAVFNPEKEHFGVDITAAKNEVVKAVMDGTVILSSWTSETGHVIQLQHRNNLISIYKHNSTLLKKVGDSVSAGDVIAILGESGELSSGPHLHFELWHDGKALDPLKFIVF